MTAALLPTLAAALATKGYDTLTSVQEAVTNPELGQADLLVSAQTGSGKTVGFGLAIAPTVLNDDGLFDLPGNPVALVIAPTRELALQVKRELSWLYAEAGVVAASCVGGMDMRDERRALERGAQLVVATPGRLVDHIKRGSIDLSEVRAVVLDEADEMLDLGFREDLEFILSEAPEDRRTLMFSATVPKAIAELAQSYQRDAVRVEVKAATSQHADIDYRALTVSVQDAENAIINVLQYYDAPNAIVFANTRAVVNRLTTRLSNRGFHVVALSGELTQTERTHALQAMRDGRARVCVATDVAARGIDLPNLDLVVHAELPSNHETLLHRSGRTGRAGRKGTSCLIVPPRMQKRAERILNEARLKADWAFAPSAEEVTARDEERLIADPMWSEPVTEGETALAARLRDTFTPDQLALAVLRQHRAAKSAPEDLLNPNQKPVPREKGDFGPSVWFSLNAGRNQRAEARWILPRLCDAGGITKDAIGAIRIQPDVTFVQIAESAVVEFMARMGQGLKLDNDLHLTQMAEGPSLTPRGAGPAKGPRKGPRPESRPERTYSDKPRFDRPDRAPRPPREDTPAHAEATPARAAEPAPQTETAAERAEAPARKPRHTAAQKAERTATTEAPARSFDRPRPVRGDEGEGRAKRVWSDDRPKKPNARPRRDEADPHEGARAPYKPRGEGKPYEKRDGDRKPYSRQDGDRPYGDKKPYAKRDGDKPYAKRDGDKPYGDKKPYAKRDGDKPYAKRDGDKPSYGDKKPYAKRDDAKPYAKRDDAKAYGDKKPYAKRDGDKPYAKRDGDKPYAKRDGDKPYAKRDGDKPFSRKPGDKPRSAGFKSHGGEGGPSRAKAFKSHGDAPVKSRAAKPRPNAMDTSKRFTPPKGPKR